MVALLLALWTAADATPLELPDEGLHIRGHDASAQLPLTVPPSKAGGRLTLPLVSSGVVDRGTSEVTVAVDDMVLATATLRQIAQHGALTVQLPPGLSGRHHLTVATHLEHQSEDCGGHEHPGLWVGLLPGAHLQPPMFDAGAQHPLAVLRGRDVRMAPDVPAEGPWLATLLAADRWVRAQGGLPHWVEAGGEVDLTVGTGEIAQVTGEPEHLRLEAASPDALLAGLLGSSAATLQATCEALPCALRPQPAAPDEAEAPDARSPVAVRLSDLGWDDGWQAEGPGWHSLHLRWQTPAGWRVTEPSQLQGAVDVRGLDGSRAGVAVYLNGERIHRSLIREGQTDLAVDLPVPEERAPLWALEIAVSLPSDRPDASWRLSAETGLHLSRNQGIAGGMSAFARSLAPGDTLPVVAEAALEPAEVGAIGALLAELPPVHLKAAEAPCDAPCLTITHDPDGGLFQRIERNGTQHWEALTGTGSVVPAHGRPWVRLAAPGRLVVHLPGPHGMGEAALAPLPWSELDSTGALAMGRAWFPVGFEPRTLGPDVVITPRSRHDEAEVRQAQLRSAYVDVAVAAVALLALVLLTLFWRNTSQRVPALEEL